MVDRNGIPLAVVLSGANVADIRMVEALVDGVAPIRQLRGRPRKRPLKVHADKAYDARWVRVALRRRGIAVRIARRGVESSARLGRPRWVVDQTFSWLDKYRRLRVRYERRADIHLAFVLLGCALICWRYIQKWFC